MANPRKVNLEATMKTLYCSLLSVLLCATSLCAGEVLGWRSKDDHSTRATLDGLLVILKKEDGQIVRIPFESLSPASQAQVIRLLQGRTGEVPEVEPVLPAAKAGAGGGLPGEAAAEDTQGTMGETAGAGVAPPERFQALKDEIKKAHVMSPQEFQALLSKMRSAIVHLQGLTVAKRQLVWEEIKSKLVGEVGQFRMRLVFPVRDVTKGRGVNDGFYFLTLSPCSGTVAGYLHNYRKGDRPVLCHRGGRIASSGYRYSPKVRLTREEVLDIGTNTHQYEMVVLVTLDKGDLFCSAPFNIYYASKQPVDCKLVKRR